MRRALVIAPNWIGDALMAQPLFALLKKLHPRIVIDAVAPTWVAPALERMPEIHDVHATDLAHGKLQMLRRWQLASDLRELGYDAAYVLPNSLKSALIPWLAGIPLRIGYTGEHRYALLNVRHANPSKARDERAPMVQHYATLAYAPGAKLPESFKTLPPPRLEADLNETARVSARFNLDTRKPLVVFCPGAEYGPAKRWPPEHFAALAQSVSQSFPYTQIVALGSPKDAAAAQAIAERAPNVRNLCGQTSLTEACALIARANAVVTNDSGLMHVAAALRRPLVALYGSTDPRHTPPLSDLAKVQWLHLECSPCFERECPLGHLKCLRELSPEQVFGDLRGMLVGQR
ncbi:lipopolysaccharide heptosyltransferase II [Burkholderia oklahomensis]|uniref:lipopolysaccharide heptosyltransferase II n=1 Tax=Burkholderia oklahomensis TaxID=342113 RepID=A0AAI8B6P4_9BURK|nr:lipopolysaccharide heptosyltransferase II [Burkholderia oklahomensis]AIO66561.1 lipopolysaccharide heptosyltransferase II [Burkholderia oklahomensis]AJX31680.1 lipopolysaccharide heptosyltransferase II [Burkholderia oklahomensis C6786]AOI43403.1 ADP-heptose--LPS heptosyltransferase [Burkholderia oklahomensis EO147]AOI46971.1 ADP-heptose--LPS heptosyltransferase [Burkholderia oklahomensis C6786]KUY54081.1 ADP-heptose--LPS heptosyltransferase [Burkholderia oklahomensis EO147]